MARNFLVDSNTIIYGSQQADGSVAQWLLEAKPWVSSISDDARIAATAELRQLTLLTADTRKNFVPRLLKLNQQGQGNFVVLSYAYANREVFFGAVMELLNDEGAASGP